MINNMIIFLSFILLSNIYAQLMLDDDFSNENIDSFEQFDSLINASPQLIELKQVNLVEEAFYDNYLIYDFSNYFNSTNRLNKLKILPYDNKISKNNNIPSRIFGNIYNNGHNNSVNDLDHHFAKRFVLNQSDLNLYLNGKIDREYLVLNNECDDTNENYECLINLKLACYDINNNLKNIFILPINLSDINDNKPLFKNDTYYLNISENLLTRTIFPLESPIDLDSTRNGVKNCSLVDLSSSEINIFEASYNSNNQRLFLILKSPLDREDKSSYVLKLTCTDGNNNSSTKLIINVLDANDNIPVFKYENKQLNISVYENELNDELTQIEAYDNDDPNCPNGQLSYTFPIDMNSEEILDSFKINESNGIISLRNTLDYEKRKKYLLKVKVQDLGPNSVPIYTDVLINVIDVNDNKPIAKLTFNDKYVVKENKKNSTIWIYEELPLNNHQFINLAYLKLIDLDMPAQNGYNLSASIEMINFLNTSSQKIEEETIESFSFRLIPIITEYNNLYYSLQLSKQTDREQKQYFDLTLKLIDNANQEYINKKQTQLINFFKIRVILIDINDNKPEFRDTVSQIDASQNFHLYKFQVKENQLKLNFARISAIDSDEGLNSKLEYTILDDNNNDLLNKYINLNKKSTYLNMNPNYLFYIDPDNGSISLRAELDREQRDLYLFTVKVNDKPENQSKIFSNEILVEINILDENDNQPIYQTSNKHFELDENKKLDTIVGNVKAYDPDINSKTEYSIEPFEMNEYFSVDKINGNLLTKKVFDAEDILKLDNNTFKLQIIARDSEIKPKIDYLFSKLNVTIHLNDVNDNPPEVVYPSKQIDRLIMFNLHDYQNTTLSSNQSIILTKLKTKDMDRDAFSNQLTNHPLHSFKITSIRRLSWQFINEVVKNQLLTIDSKIKHGKVLNNSKIGENYDDYKKILEFLEILVEVQKLYEIKPISKINLRSVFSVNSTYQGLSTADAIIYLNQMKYLNWGVYNFSIQVNDSSLKTDLTIKLFVYNLNYVSNNKTILSQSFLNENQLLKMNELIDEWWSNNSNLVTNFKKRFDSKHYSSSNNHNTSYTKFSDDNGDDIDAIAQEYYKYYSANSFSSVKRGFFNVTSNLFNTATVFLLNNPSSSIIIMISLFLFISIFLIFFISYKHYKQSNQKNKNLDKLSGNDNNNSSYKKSLKNHKDKKFLNLNQTDNKNTNLAANNTNQYDDINDSHILSKRVEDSIDKSATIAAVMASVVSSPNRYNSLNPSQQKHHSFSLNGSTSLNNTINKEQVKQYLNTINRNFDSYQQYKNPLVNNLNENNNESNENLAVNENVNKTNKNENIIVKKNSISSTSTSSSVTPITTNSIVQISGSSSSNNSTNQLNLIDNNQNLPNPTNFLSTFIPASSLNTLNNRNETKPIKKNNNNTICINQENEKEEMIDTLVKKNLANNLSNDIGYYGSSDYSDNNASISISTTCQKPIKQYSNKSKIIKYQHQQSRSRFIQPNKSTTINSATSFTSSSLSSPTSSSSSTSSESPLFATGLPKNNQVIINKNNDNQQDSDIYIKPSNYINLTKTTSSSSSSTSTKNNDVKLYYERFERIYNSNHLDQNNTTQPPKQQRNSLTAYSYV